MNRVLKPESIQQLFYIQCMLPNLKNEFQRPKKKIQEENFAHFGKYPFFQEKRSRQYFVFFDPKKVFAKAKK